MKFLKLLGKYLLLGGTLLIAFSFLIMFLISYFQMMQLSRLVSSAKQLARKPTHAHLCQLGDPTDVYPLLGYQVRFENDTDFVLEALCVSAVKGPFEVSRSRLQLGVRKLPSYSGILFPVVPVDDHVGRVAVKLGYGGWMLESGGNSARVKVTPFVFQKKDTLPFAGVGAAQASCEGWGYSCCNALTQVGVGVAVSRNIVSCPDSCYARCLERPSLLVFTTDQEIDPNTRKVILPKNNQGLIFSYSAQDIDSASLLATIDYGDGQTASSSNHTDQFSHIYSCQQASCDYQVKLVVTDSENLTHSRTRISDITVLVR